MKEKRFLPGAQWRHKNLGLLVHIVRESDTGHFHLAYVDKSERFEALGFGSGSMSLHMVLWTRQDLDREFRYLVPLPWQERLDDAVEELDEVLAEQARQKALAMELAANGVVAGQEGEGVPPESDSLPLKVYVGETSVFAMEVTDI